MPADEHPPIRIEQLGPRRFVVDVSEAQQRVTPSLAEAGQAYYERIKSLLDDMDELDATVRSASGVPRGLFKCNLRRLADYAALSSYLATMLAVPGVAETVSIEHIKAGYYSIKALNPNGIVPKGPDLPGLAPVLLKAKH